MINTLSSIIYRDLLLAFRQRYDVLTTLFFFVITVLLFPLGIGPDKTLLRTIAPGILWAVALLATMLSLGRLFASDYADGTLEQMRLSSEPFILIVIGKIFSHWLITGLPLLLLTPILALPFDLPSSSIGVLFVSLLIGTPILSLIGAIGAALTLGTRNGGALLAVLILPLYIPTLIFGAGAVNAETSGLGSRSHLLLLGGILSGTVALAPWITSAALQIALE